MVNETRLVVVEALNELESTPQEKKLLLALRKLALDDSAFRRQRRARRPRPASSSVREGRARSPRVGDWCALRPPSGPSRDRGRFGHHSRGPRGRVVLRLTQRRAAAQSPAVRCRRPCLLVMPGRSASGGCCARCEWWSRCCARPPINIERCFKNSSFGSFLFQMSARPGGGYRIEIDGPYSLFESVTKYGLELALLLPALEACDSVQLTADLRWGKKRDPLSFSLSLTQARNLEPSPPRDEVQALLDAFRESESWRAEPAQEVLDLPGIGLCVPDLCFTHQGTGELVLCEVAGLLESRRSLATHRARGAGPFEQDRVRRQRPLAGQRRSVGGPQIRPHFTCTKLRSIPRP